MEKIMYETSKYNPNNLWDKQWEERYNEHYNKEYEKYFKSETHYNLFRMKTLLKLIENEIKTMEENTNAIP